MGLGRRFTPEEDRLMIEMRLRYSGDVGGEGSLKQIANLLGRDWTTVYHRLMAIAAHEEGMKKRKPYFVWTDEICQTVRRLRSEGKTYRAIAKIIGCSDVALYKRVQFERRKEKRNATQTVDKRQDQAERKQGA